MTVAQHRWQDPALGSAAAKEDKPGWFARLLDRLSAPTEPVAEPEKSRPEPAKPKETHATPAPRLPHPPFAMKPAYSAHVLDRLIHRLVELRADPEMTAIKAIERLYDLNEELSKLAQHEFDQQRRMARNAEDVQAQAALLADAARRGKDAEGVAQAAEGIAGRAAHVADLEATGIGTLRPITPDTPDPREASAHAETPVPSEPFLAGEDATATAVLRPAVPPTGPVGSMPLPHREPKQPEGLAHEVHAPGPTTTLPVQGVAQTAVMHVVGEVDIDDSES